MHQFSRFIHVRKRVKYSVGIRETHTLHIFLVKVPPK